MFIVTLALCCLYRGRKETRLTVIALVNEVADVTLPNSIKTRGCVSVCCVVSPILRGINCRDKETKKLYFLNIERYVG